jgi:hypothetical protein
MSKETVLSLVLSVLVGVLSMTFQNPNSAASITAPIELDGEAREAEEAFVPLESKDADAFRNNVFIN